MIRYVILVLLAFLVWRAPAYAEPMQYQDVIMQNAAVATGQGTAMSLNQASVARLDVSITGVATVDFTIAGSGNFAAYPKLCTPSDSTTGVTSTTVGGVFYCLVAGGNALRAPVSAYTSGTVTVVGRSTVAR